MKIRLVFLHQASGKGVIRARVYGDHFRVLTVGDYYRMSCGDWTARLWATPGDKSAIVPDGLITASDVTRLSNAAAGRGKWWT